MRLVWAVGWGEYEQWDIVAVFQTKAQAETFCRLNDRNHAVVHYRPLQLAECDEDVPEMWPRTGEIPK